MKNNEQYIQDDSIDLRELFSVLKKRKKLIWLVTALFTLMALIYIFIATPWWEVSATLEIGKYKKTYLENGSSVSERLNVAYVNVPKYIKDRDSKIKRINASKKNPQFITITALGKSNDLALSEIQKVIQELQNKHQKVIDEIIATKKSQLDQVDRSILQINQNKIPKIEEKIKYLQDVELKAIKQKITTVKNDLEKSLKQKSEATQNLLSLKNEASLAALRLAQIQGLEYKISENKIKLIDLDTRRQKISFSRLPSLKRDVASIRNIDLAALKEKRKLIVLSMQSHNYHNTSIIGKIITQDKAVKPKKALIMIVAFLTGLMLSIFLAFFLEFLKEK